VIVVDTNVVVYSVINSEFTLLAEQVMRADAEWSSPPLWRSEFRNVLLLYIRNGKLDLRTAIEITNEAEQLIVSVEHSIDSPRVLELAVRSGCTAYDCEFVYLAEALGVPLVTSDKKLVKAFPSITVSMEAFVK
jgi:predicted nucleic acid-binding protein